MFWNRAIYFNNLFEDSQLCKPLGFGNLFPTVCVLKFHILQSGNNIRVFIQAKVSIPSVWIKTKLICQTWSFCVPLEIAWRAKKADCIRCFNWLVIWHETEKIFTNVKLDNHVVTKNLITYDVLLCIILYLLSRFTIDQINKSTEQVYSISTEMFVLKNLSTLDFWSRL